MTYEIIENNQAIIIGQVASEFSFSYEISGEGCYIVNVLVKRANDSEDFIQLLISERLIDVYQDYTGKFISAWGQIRSGSQQDNKVLYVFVREVSFVDEETDANKTNRVVLDGCICKEPIYRKTILEREITDLKLNVKRPNGEVDCIPCICWCSNARYASILKIGERVQVIGRIHSRKYVKKLSEDVEEGIAYEVAVDKMEKLD